jgi:methylenetetrahydrofolate dehydrogenase (NADP+)/methenyltetrahydrofolate cyclohydrolase
MTECQIIDGKLKAKEIISIALDRINNLVTKVGVKIGLAVILVGNDPASKLYVSTKAKKASELGIQSQIFEFSENANENDILDSIDKLNKDTNITGMLIQLPLPNHINTQKIIDKIDPRKDIDGFTTHNVGLLNSWQDSLEPCTPQGVLILLKDIFARELSGKKAVIIGRSRIVGRPMSSILIRESCSVTVLNSHSRDLASECRTADILISAVGSPSFVKGSWIKKGACVIDVGIIKVEDKFRGDIDFEEAKKVASYITPVPGGVGPMTVACLMLNTIKAAYIQHKLIW